MVQVQKEELRLAILRAAQDEFLQNGYLSASVKQIAAMVGISVGNLYRYYSGKEALFDAIVAPVYSELERLMRDHSVPPLDEGHIVELVVNVLTEITGENRKPLLILIDGSKGTQHEEAGQQFYKTMADDVTKHLEEYNCRQGHEVFTKQVAWPISVAFLQGYFEIIRRYVDAEDCKIILRQYVSFWYQGLRAFI
jgi:AcrR family transcriptional regulator